MAHPRMPRGSSELSGSDEIFQDAIIEMKYSQELSAMS